MYRFDMAFLSKRFLGRCDVAIYAKGIKPKQPSNPIIVLTQRDHNMGPSIANNIEKVCTQVHRDYLLPLRINPDDVTWIQHFVRADEESWRRVTFEQRHTEPTFSIQIGQDDDDETKETDQRVLPRYANPKWHNTDPVIFDPDTLVPDVYWVDEREIIDLRIASLEDFSFTADECHRMETGICSLDPGALSSDTAGQRGYEYCRDLAVLAQIWGLLLELFEGNVPVKDMKACTSATVASHIVSQWEPTFGPVPCDLITEIESSIKLYGAADRSQGIVAGFEDNGELGFSDGRHRSCIARHLDISVGVFVARERTRQK